MFKGMFLSPGYFSFQMLILSSLDTISGIVILKESPSSGLSGMNHIVNCNPDWYVCLSVPKAKNKDVLQQSFSSNKAKVGSP